MNGSHDDCTSKDVAALNRELELHVLFRLDSHDRASCTRCRLVAWLAGEGHWNGDHRVFERERRNLALVGA